MYNTDVYLRISVGLNICLVLILIYYVRGRTLSEGYSLFDDIAVSITGPIQENMYTGGLKGNSRIDVKGLRRGSNPVSVRGDRGDDLDAFADPDASWIWGVPSDHPHWLFFSNFVVENDTDATIYLRADDKAIVYIDGVIVLKCDFMDLSGGTCPKTQVSLLSGDHFIAIYGSNFTNKGGVVCAVVDSNGKTLTATNESWLSKKIKM